MPYGEQQLTGGARKRGAKEEKMKEESKPPTPTRVGAPAPASCGDAQPASEKQPHPCKPRKDGPPRGVFADQGAATRRFEREVKELVLLTWRACCLSASLQAQ